VIQFDCGHLERVEEAFKPAKKAWNLRAFSSEVLPLGSDTAYPGG